MAFTWLEANIFRVLQIFPTVAASGSLTRTAIPLALFGGRIVSISMHTANSLQFDFSLYQNATSVEGTVDEIYRVDGATQFWQWGVHPIRFVNTDSPQTANLYLTLENQSEVAPTGDITLQLYIQGSGSGV